VKEPTASRIGHLLRVPVSLFTRWRQAPDEEKEAQFVASQWRLMWWKFSRHRLAVVSMYVLVAFYATVILADFAAPFDPRAMDARYVEAPPTTIHFVDVDGHFQTVRPVSNLCRTGHIFYAFRNRLKLHWPR
jgi:hypothetical protein